jgi:hypothetical protein
MAESGFEGALSEESEAGEIEAQTSLSPRIAQHAMDPAWVITFEEGRRH